MRFPFFAGLALLLVLSGCTAGKNQIALIDCATHHTPLDPKRPKTPADAERVEFCK